MASAGLYHLLYEPLICGQGNHVSRFCFCLSLVFVMGVVIMGELELCLFRVEKTSFHGEWLQRWIGEWIPDLSATLI